MYVTNVDNMVSVRMCIMNSYLEFLEHKQKKIGEPLGF